LRKLGAALLLLPALAGFYLGLAVRRGTALRLGAVLAAAGVVTLVVFVSQTPARSTAVPVSTPRAVSADLLRAVQTGQPLAEPFELRFDASMDAASVAGALRITPDAAVRLAWDGSSRVLTVTPVDHWRPDTLYAVTVDRSARAADGGVLASEVHGVFLTRPAGSAEIVADGAVADGAVANRIRLDATFRIELDRPMSPDAVRMALHMEPLILGELAQGESGSEFVFTPSGGLEPNRTYRLWLGDLVDRDGVAFAATPSIKVRTIGAPKVVRFRPLDGTGRVQRSATLSVRFTESMNRKSTAAAFRVTADGKAVKGRISWAESGEVLVFQPAAALPYAATVKMTVAGTARSRHGATLTEAATGSFTIAAKPKPRAVARPATRSGGSTPIPRPGGGGAVSGSWHSVELYYLKLMNCTRTGGWVTSSGSCSSPGGRNVAPLGLSAGISNHVSRPYAKLLATRNLCDHFIGGNPGDRLRHAGYTSYRWAENLGCRSGNPYSAVLGSHLYFQSEKPYNGGHYVNLMNSAYDRVGIGVWVSSGRVRLVVDFYHP
jgi:uncharacterized protein YkwD